MACKERPKYRGEGKPLCTNKYPDGCPDCWFIYAFVNSVKQGCIGEFDGGAILHEAPKLNKEN